MIAQNLDLEEFLRGISSVGYNNIMEVAETEATEAERLYYRFRQQDKGKQAITYANQLKNLIFLLRYQARPSGLSKDDYNYLFSLRNRIAALSFKGQSITRSPSKDLC